MEQEMPFEDDEWFSYPTFQPIPNGLMVGDFIEITGICRNKDASVELTVESEHDQTSDDVLPLFIGLSVGGPVTVKSINRGKVEQQEHNVRMGLQHNLNFQMYIYAKEEGYEIVLNNERVCLHKHLIPLEDVNGILLDNINEYTSIEFRDIFTDPDQDEVKEASEPGLIRVQELRESFSRKKGSPTFIRTSMRRSKGSVKLGRKIVEEPPNISSPDNRNGQPMAKDLPKVAMESAVSSYMAPELSRSSQQEPFYQASADTSNNKRGGQKPLFGARKSITLNEDKLGEYYVVGGKESKTVAGDAHQGTYQPISDEYQPHYRANAQSSSVGSYGNLKASNASLQQKDKKKRGSWLFGKSNKSLGSESDLSTGEKEKKSKGMKGLFSRKKSTPTVSTGNVRQASSMPNVYQSGSSYYDEVQPLYLGMASDMDPVKGPLPISYRNETAPVMAAYLAGQKAVPEFENFSLTSEHSLMSSTTPQPSTGLNSMARNEPSSSARTPILSMASATTTYKSSPDLYSPRTETGQYYLGIGADQSPVRGPLPKSLLKEPPTAIAAYIAAQKAVPEFEDYMMTNDGGSFTYLPIYEDTAPKTAISPAMEAQTRKLKGTAPELADILLESGKARADPSVTLTGGVKETVRAIETSYISNPPTTYTQPSVQKDESALKLKGPAPEVAALLENKYRDQYYNNDTTLTTDMPQSSILPRVTSVAVEKNVLPKVQQSAPQTAAQMANQYNNVDRYSKDATYVPIKQSDQPKPQYVERPKIDVDQQQTVKSQYVKPVAGWNRAASMDSHQYKEYDSDGSTVHSDGEYYLDVGKTDYYLERQRSLKNYRSKRSRKRDKEARSSMGLQTSKDSIHSSISSLELEDLNGPQSKRGQPNNWAKDQANGHVDNTYYPTKATNSRVYAEAPMVEAPIVYNTTLEACEYVGIKSLPNFQVLLDLSSQLRTNNFGAVFPLKLTPGRSARIVGHFLPQNAEQDCCFIRLTINDSTIESRYSALLLEIWSNGNLSVYGVKQDEPVYLQSWISPDFSRLHENFTVELHARGLYSAVTVFNHVTLKLPSSFDPVILTRLQLEPCTNAELDLFSVTNDLLLPLTLMYPHQSHLEESQSVTLKTKLTADSKCICLKFSTQTNKWFKLLFDFELDGVYLQPDSEEKVEDYQIKPTEIPYVPEQISEVQVSRNSANNKLMVTVNKTEILSLPIPLKRPVGKLSSVHISGDFVLVNAKFN